MKKPFLTITEGAEAVLDGPKSQNVCVNHKISRSGNWVKSHKISKYANKTF